MHLTHQRHYTASMAVQKVSHYQSGQPKRPSHRQHLLSLMASFTRANQEIGEDEAEELCCYDRVKKLLCPTDQDPTEHQLTQLSQAVNIQRKINQMEQKLNSSQSAKQGIGARHGSLERGLRRTKVVEEMKRQCLDRFMAHRAGGKQKAEEEARKAGAQMVEESLDKLVEQKQMTYTRLHEENQRLGKELRARDLQLQQLKVQQKIMREHIEELEIKCQGRRDTRKATDARTAAQSFKSQFEETFGEMTIEEVRHKLEVSVSRCLEQFDRVQNRNQDRIKEQAAQYQQKCRRMEEKIVDLEERENNLVTTLKTVKINKKISEVEINELYKDQQRLVALQKLILSLYNEWYAQRSEGEKKLMKCTGNLVENYSYQQMLKYVFEYKKRYSTDDKLNQFLFKVLRGVQKIKREIAPDQCNEKLDALTTLEQVEKWVKLKAGQGRRGLKKKTIMRGEQDSYLD